MVARMKRYAKFFAMLGLTLLCLSILVRDSAADLALGSRFSVHVGALLDHASALIRAATPAEDEPRVTFPSKPIASCADDPKCAALAQHVLAAMDEWAPPVAKPVRGETANHAQSRYADFWLETPVETAARHAKIAAEIASVVLDAAEPPLWVDDANKVRTAILLATIGYWEGARFHLAVDDGRINDRTWRLSAIGKRTMPRTGDADGGYAYSRYQLHVECGGLVLTDSGYHTACTPGDGAVPIPGNVIAHDGRMATRLALHELRQSIQRTGTLVAYTGEVTCPCPKARVRLDFALHWSAAHPMR